MVNQSCFELEEPLNDSIIMICRPPLGLRSLGNRAVRQTPSESCAPCSTIMYYDASRFDRRCLDLHLGLNLRMQVHALPKGGD